MSSLVGLTVVEPALTAVPASAAVALLNAVISWFTWVPTVPSEAVWFACMVTGRGDVLARAQDLLVGE